MSYATFERFELRLKRADALSVSGPGRADEAVEVLARVPYVRKQLDAINPAELRAELREYGAWNASELADDEQNKRRIIWIAGGNIRECAP